MAIYQLTAANLWDRFNIQTNTDTSEALSPIQAGKGGMLRAAAYGVFDRYKFERGYAL